MRECHLRSSAGGMAQPTGSVAGSSSAVAMCPRGRVFRRQQAVVEEVVELLVLAVPRTVYML